MALLTTAEYESYTNTTLTPAETTYVNTLIGIVQDQIETYCDRKLDATDYLEWYKYSRYLVLRQYPVNHIKYVGELDLVGSFDSEDYNYEWTSTALYITDNTLTTTTITFGGAITTLTDIKTAVELALPAITLTINSGYTNLNYKLIRVGTGRDIYGAKRNDCQTKLVEDENRTVEFVMDSGFVFFTSADTVCDTNVLMVYNAGWATADMPEALKQIAVNIIKDIMNIQTAGMTGLYQSETITNYSYTLGQNVTQYVGKELDKYTDLLQPFVKKTV